MKTLFQDNVIEKLKKVPTVLWFFLLAIAEFCGTAYVTIENGKISAAEYAKAFSDTGIAFDANVFMIVFCVFSPIVSALICEILMRVAYAVVRRLSLNVTKADFCFRIRLVIIISDFILGIIGITYFFFPNVRDLLVAIFECSVLALLLAWFYEDFRVKFVPKQNHAKVFSFVAEIVLGIYFVIAMLNLIYMLVYYRTQMTPLELAAVIVEPVVILLLAGGAVANYFRLKKISSEPDDDIDIQIDEKPKDETIFKDFGF